MGKVGKLISNVGPSVDTAASDFRMGKYGDVFTLSPMEGLQAAAEEGSYFATVNATDDTAITASIATAYSGTASGFIAIQNKDILGGKNIIMDYVKMITKVPPASATDWRFVVDVDTVLSRYTSAGTAITPVCTNVGVGTASIAGVAVGALVTVALSSAGRTYARVIARSQIPVLNDMYVLTFGSTPPSASNSGLTVGTSLVYNVPPVVIPPQGTLVISAFGKSNAITAWTAQVEMGWIER